MSKRKEGNFTHTQEQLLAIQDKNIKVLYNGRIFELTAEGWVEDNLGLLQTSLQKEIYRVVQRDHPDFEDDVRYVLMMNDYILW